MSNSPDGAAGPSEQRAVGLVPLIITIHEVRDLPIKDVSAKTDPFVLVEAAGVRSQTDVQRGTVNPLWDQMLTLRCVFAPGMREELIVSVFHEDVFEDVIVGRGTLDISATPVGKLMGENGEPLPSGTTTADFIASITAEPPAPAGSTIDGDVFRDVTPGSTVANR